MKKYFGIVLLSLILTSCNFVPSSENTSNKHGVQLSISCSEPLTVKNHSESEYSTRYKPSKFAVGTSTIKLQDGKITFYRPPVMGEYQLKEDDGIEPQYRYHEEQIDFRALGADYDFVYISDIVFQSKAPDNKLFKNLRIALFEKETMDYYYSFSSDEQGTATSTSRELDLNADGVNEGTYTTGNPMYMTDSYNFVIPNENEINNNNIPLAKGLIKLDKTLTLRVWLEGWDLENSDITGDFDADIGITFAAHKAK